jgi:aryl-alcohol dehydrogenase-like predicted oxidoreductase
LEENVAATEVQLTKEELKTLDGIHAYGERYPEVNRAFVQK